MKRDHEELVPSTDDANPVDPIDLSTLVLGEVTELTNDGNPFNSRFDVFFWGQWYPNS
jgi:hypothetical protein